MVLESYAWLVTAVRGHWALRIEISGDINMAGKIIKNSTVTREQYDKLQVDVVNRIEELEQTVERLVTATAETMTVQTTDNRRLAQANNNRHFEVRVVGVIALIGFATGIASLISMVLV